MSDLLSLLASIGMVLVIGTYLNHSKKVISPHKDTCSTLVKKTAKERIVFMDNLNKKLGYKTKKHRLSTKP